LHAVGHAFQDGTSINLSGWDPSRAKNLFAGQTVHSILLEVPDKELLADAGNNRRIGVFAVSTLATDAGGWRPINRVALPMIHPLFTQFYEDLGNRLNAGCPADDLSTHGKTVTKAKAGVVAPNGTALPSCPSPLNNCHPACPEERRERSEGSAAPLSPSSEISNFQL
jgi:hypothetical protein